MAKKLVTAKEELFLEEEQTLERPVRDHVIRYTNRNMKMKVARR